MKLTEKERQEHIERIRLGERAKRFLASEEWREFVKPIIDSMIRGLTDIRDLKSADMASEMKATVEVKARKLAADYLENLNTLLEGYVIDGDVSTKILEPVQEKEPLYRESK